MSSFTDPLLVEVEQGERAGRGLARLIKPFTYEVGFLGSGVLIVVPAGFETDFASVPRWAMPFIPIMGKAAKAAVVHDFLCENRGSLAKARIDAIFLEAMEVLGVSWLRRTLMFLAVRTQP